MLRRGGEYQPTVLRVGDLSLDAGSGLLRCGTESVLSFAEYAEERGHALELSIEEGLTYTAELK